MRLLLLPLFVNATFLLAQDTIRVRSHQREIVVTDPATGVRSFPRTARFPTSATPLRQVLLSVTFACPDSLRCAEWDYLDHVRVNKPGSPNSVEIARMLTPYGGLFRGDWWFRWEVDVTDFAPLLRDSVEVTWVHSGFEPNNDRGWAVTLEFTCITGPPAAEVLAVHSLHDGRFAYGDAAAPFEQAVPPRTYTLNDRTRIARLRLQQTGHGMHADDGCAEFCRKWRELRWDGRVVDRRWLWRECGTNPLQPQAGTWIFDRGHWCPGELQQPDIVDVPVRGPGPHTVQLAMEPYVHDSSTAAWSIAAHLIELGQPRARHDAALARIIAPSDAPMDRPYNPVCAGARIALRNLGSDTLRSLDIRHGTADGMQLHRWSGALAFGDTAVVELEAPIVTTSTERFTVHVDRPNGHADAWPHDNVLTTTLRPVPTYPTPLVVQLLTNNEPRQNTLQVYAADGRVLLERGPESLDSARLYTDTLRLAEGCYTLQLTDTAGDGLEFWYNTGGGRGTLRLLDAEGRLLRRFESDHGSGITLHFRIAANAPQQRDTLPDVGLFPTRTPGPTVLDYFAAHEGHVGVFVFDQGDTLRFERDLGRLRQARVPLDLGALPQGRYAVVVRCDGREVQRRRLRIVRD